jgi:hypothetical protein
MSRNTVIALIYHPHKLLGLILIYAILFWSKRVNSAEHQIIHIGGTKFQTNSRNDNHSE